MSSYDYPQGRESSHTHRPLADPANKLSYVVVSSSGVQKKLVNPTKGEEPIDLGLEKQEIIDSINERAAEHAHHHHHYHDEFGPESTAYHDGEHHHGHAHCHSEEPPAQPATIARSEAAAQPAAELPIAPVSGGAPEPATAEANLATANSKDEKAAKPKKKQVKAALKAAAVNVSAKKFAKMWTKRDQESGISSVGCFEASGCYAILRYPKGAKKATQFTDAYVGGSHNMGASVMRQLQGDGNPDVYADMKYGQDLRVLLYPYPEELLRAKSHELIMLFDANRSYNRRS